MMKNGNLDAINRWSLEDAANLYGIRDWGAGYFDLAADGTVAVKVNFAGKPVSVSLMEIISGIRSRGMKMPLLLRFENILGNRIQLINESFKKAIAQAGYRGEYRGVFPIKVNQQQHILEAISNFSKEYHYGLEAGSKAELIVALAMLSDPQALLICNGYKDEEFLDLALHAQKMGYRCFIVLEKPSELSLLLERAKLHQVRPLIGVRIKLSTQAGMPGSKVGGDRSIFGLSPAQLVDVLDMLRKAGMLDCLQLLHYHLGTQISNIRDIRAAVTEACRFYVDLVREGAAMGFMDLGGGLAVDYDGSQTNYVHSKNYSLDEYCADIVEVLQQTLDEKEIPHPVIVTESGRATVAYCSVLLFEVLDVVKYSPSPLPEKIDEEKHEYLHNLMEVLRNLKPKNIQECYNDAIYYRDELRELFKQGQIGLRDRALADSIFLEIMHTIARSLNKLRRMPPALEGLGIALSDVYYGNFSVFQSLPDFWAVDQIFPVMPIHRLTEQPTREGIFADLTCDTDGRIDRFADLHDVRRTLPLHEVAENEPYFIGVFLVGAYQENLGDLHNLFGDTHVAGIRINEDGTHDIIQEIEGDSVADVISYVEFNPKTVLEMFRQKAEKAVREGRISVQDRKVILEGYESSLRGYTYYER